MPKQPKPDPNGDKTMNKEYKDPRRMNYFKVDKDTVMREEILNEAFPDKDELDAFVSVYVELECMILSCIPDNSVTAQWLKNNDIKTKDSWNVHDMLKNNTDIAGVKVMRWINDHVRRRLFLTIFLRYLQSDNCDMDLVRENTGAVYKYILNEHKITIKQLADMFHKVAKDTQSIKDMEDPPEEVQMMAVMQDPGVIRHIKIQTERTQFEVVFNGGSLYGLVSHTTRHVENLLFKQLNGLELTGRVEYVEIPQTIH